MNTTPQHLATVASQSPDGTLPKLSEAELDAYAIAQSIWRHLRRSYGYQPFGLDWRTLRLTSPHIASVLADCYRTLGVSHA